MVKIVYKLVFGYVDFGSYVGALSTSLYLTLVHVV